MAEFSMRLQPFPTAIIAVIVLAGASLFFGNVAEGVIPIAINPERRQLLEDALHWMSFMQNGTFASNKTVNALFLRQILERYRTSKFYRSFVIAFQYGVLPRLTLAHRNACLPQLILRDDSNISLTWHYLKKLTFDSYRDRHLITADVNDISNKFCDFRQGLFCRPYTNNPSSGQCNCPEDAMHVKTFDPVAANSTDPPIFRCLMDKDKSCSLIDLDHGNDPKHSSLAANMYHLMFNLDKPIPCKEGTQCRFKDTDLSTPRCYEPSQGPFHPPPPLPNGTIETWTLPLGANCTIGLYADPGSCEVNTNQKYGPLPGLVCYNFRPPHPPVQEQYPIDHRKGFCAHEHGQYGVVSVATSANGQLQYHPLFMSYVYPRNVPLIDDDLLSYYLRFLNQVHKKLFLEHVQREVDESCDVQTTKDFSDLFWNYYSTELDKPLMGAKPPRDVTKDILEKKLEEAIRLADDTTKGICRVYAYYYRSSPTSKKTLVSPLQCVPRYGQKYGQCKRKTIASRQQTYAINLGDFLDKTSLIEMERVREEVDVDEEILRDNPETFCTPQTSFRQVHGAPLENGMCPQGFFCYEDFGDHQKDIYDATCELNTNLTLNFSCHEGRDGIDYGKCEVEQLEKMINQHIPDIEAASRLGLGDHCVHEKERIIRSWIRGGKNGETNKYKVLALAETVVSSKRLFCNASRLLECKLENECGCVESTAPRKFPDTDNGVEGDYCYLTKGSCSEIDLSKFVPLTTNELLYALYQYGENVNKPGDFCPPRGNLCLHLDTDREICRPSENGNDGDDGSGFAGVADLRGQSGESWKYFVVSPFYFVIINSRY